MVIKQTRGFASRPV